ncbi:hypothetical protein COCON_G00234510 [Conger conger]|uniref:Uncharacterized protein n=1 Tax=Conger conger TaxID=82655 RepID=A0A9Q1CT73_CONCO|nr:hypothetical protein COCON_G00234510 [Conger conger]
MFIYVCVFCNWTREDITLNYSSEFSLNREVDMMLFCKCECFHRNGFNPMVKSTHSTFHNVCHCGEQRGLYITYRLSHICVYIYIYIYIFINIYIYI